MPEFDKDRKYWFLMYYKLRCLESGKTPENEIEINKIINFALQYEKNVSSGKAVDYTYSFETELAEE